MNKNIKLNILFNVMYIDECRKSEVNTHLLRSETITIRNVSDIPEKMFKIIAYMCNNTFCDII